MIFYPSRIPDPGVKKAPYPGSGSATLVLLTTVLMLCQVVQVVAGHAEHGSAAGLPGLCRPLLTQPHHPGGDDHPQEHLHLLQGRAGKDPV